ncbi:MAG: hypothetical protein AAF337_12230 [Pseudomonadota bacterium]
MTAPGLCVAVVQHAGFRWYLSVWFDALPVANRAVAGLDEMLIRTPLEDATPAALDTVCKRHAAEKAGQPN